LRSLLGCFLFSGDDVFKRIGVLSGGERNRYALLKMLLHPANFLLLDEPTNHLDLRAKDVLLEALMKYTGTVVFVSHDRYFIDKLATRVFEIGDGKVEIYPGNYEDYLWRKQGRNRGRRRRHRRRPVFHRCLHRARERRPRVRCRRTQGQAPEPDQAPADGRPSARNRRRDRPRRSRDCPV
jgi:ABC-type multidrug transport system ATPase subunit